MEIKVKKSLLLWLIKQHNLISRVSLNSFSCRVCSQTLFKNVLDVQMYHKTGQNTTRVYGAVMEMMEESGHV